MSLLNKCLFIRFSSIFDILCTRSFQGVPLPQFPISTYLTRQHPDMSNSASFLLNSLNNYFQFNYRFQCKTFDIAVSIGKLLNFDSLISPSYHELYMLMNPSNLDTFDKFLSIINGLPFEDKCHIDNFV